MDATEYYAALIDLSPRLMRFAIRLTRGRPEAADLHAETLCKALENRRQFRPDSPLWPFVATIMKNVFITDYQRRARWFRIRERINAKPIQEAAEGVQIDLNAIDRHRRQEVRLFAEGYTYNEIAVISGVCVGTVKSRIRDNRQQLIKLISKPNF